MYKLKLQGKFNQCFTRIIKMGRETEISDRIFMVKKQHTKLVYTIPADR
jgi:hypothetical protein